MQTLLGIEEAGRGPVIGPMVMAGVLIYEKDSDKLRAIGAKDSKLLTPKQRSELFQKIKKIAKNYKIIIIPPSEIDAALESADLNLNWLEAHKSAEILNELQPDKVIIDSPSNNVKSYKNYLLELLEWKNADISVEHKAERHPVVAAASILAKVTRDKEIEKIKKKYGDCGPGYPANEITQRFLKENWEKHPEIFRHSWESYKRLARAKNQKKLGEF